ncbi:SCO5389 family protein [Frankia sp. Cppng1_Ct_nod]|uniref:SCO5389 family protein n=1 Tax=Frankia sp. Cppng1_Ct_nod TaxID=2897162 RepID=UPI0010416855|nr:SCO5389 family protein [Frankia sp. Cppng1_Ct_nod]
MSLTVTPELVEAANRGHVDDDAFLACVRMSLPYAYDMVAQLAAELPEARADGRRDFADSLVPPPDDTAAGQLLRAMASTSIRGALERYFGVRIAFQNCHRVAVFAPGTTDGDQYRRFVSAEAQILNQQPGFVNC